MNRRRFLQTLAAGAVGLTLDPERLLWVPGAKKIFIPAPKPVLLAPVWLRAGDMFTIGDVCAVNPRTYEHTPFRQRFVVTSDVQKGQPITPLVLWPPMVTEGVYQNVTREPFVGETVALDFPELTPKTGARCLRIEGFS